MIVLTLSAPISGTTLVALILREVEAGQNSGGGSLVWAVTEPVLGIFLLSLIFMMAFPSPPLGESFALFYATGLLPLILFQDVSQKMTIALRHSRPLFGFARVGVGDVVIARFAFSLLSQLVAAALILSGLGLIAGSFWNYEPQQIGMTYVCLAGLSFGAGLFGCWLAGIWPMWPRVWAVFLRPLVFISGVFFLVDEIGDPFRDWLMWNPLAHVIASLRSGVFVGYSADLLSLAYVASVAVILGALGFCGLMFNKHSLIDGLG